MKFKCTTNSLLLAAKNGSQFNSFENGNRTTDGTNLCYNFVIKEFYSDCVYIKYTSDKIKFFLSNNTNLVTELISGSRHTKTKTHFVNIFVCASVFCY